MSLFCFALVFLFLINSLTSNFHSFLLLSCFLLPFPSLISLSFFISFFSFFALHSLCSSRTQSLLFIHLFSRCYHCVSYILPLLSLGHPLSQFFCWFHFAYFIVLSLSLTFTFFIFFLLSCLLSKSASLFHFFAGILPSLFPSRDRDDPQKHVCLLSKTLRVFFHC